MRAIDKQTAMRILYAIALYANSGNGDVKRLQDIVPPECRLRMGDYRVRFYEFEDSIHILGVKHRPEAYR